MKQDCLLLFVFLGCSHWNLLLVCCGHAFQKRGGCQLCKIPVLPIVSHQDFYLCLQFSLVSCWHCLVFFFCIFLILFNFITVPLMDLSLICISCSLLDSRKFMAGRMILFLHRLPVSFEISRSRRLNDGRKNIGKRDSHSFHREGYWGGN